MCSFYFKTIRSLYHVICCLHFVFLLQARSQAALEALSAGHKAALTSAAEQAEVGKEAALKEAAKEWEAKVRAL